MFDWLKKLSEDRPWQNKAGLDEKALALLAEDLGRLGKLHLQLPRDAMRYVLDGEGDEVLTRLAGSQNAGEALELIGAVAPRAAHDDNARSHFFTEVRCADPALFVRLGKIYEAALHYRKTSLIAQFPTAGLAVRCFGDPSLEWLEILLIEAFQLSLNVWPRRCRACPALTADLLETLLELEGHPRDLLVRTAFQPPLQSFVGQALEPIFEVLVGLGQSAVRHRHAVLTALDHSDFKQRVYALTLMKKCRVPSAEFLDKLMELALGSSKQVREPAEGLLAQVKPIALPLLERKSTDGDNEERPSAARLLWRWEGEKARGFLTMRAEQEKNKKVAQVIGDLLAVAQVEPTPEEANALELPPLPPIPSHSPLGSETEKAWIECLDKVNAGITQALTNQSTYYVGHLKNIPNATIRVAFQQLQGGTERKLQPLLADIGTAAWIKELKDSLCAFWQRPDLAPVHLVRFLILIRSLLPDEQQSTHVVAYSHWLDTLLPPYRRTHPEVGLRELGAAFESAGLDVRRLGEGLLANHREERLPFGLPPALIWPYWAEHLDMLERAFEPATGDYMTRWQRKRERANSFHALATFPKPPTKLVPQLLDLALGPKSERAVAQRCLEGLPDKLSRLVASLTSGSAESRLAAAEWLGRLGDKSAITPLKTALTKERNETTKGGMMSALEQLGVPVEQFLDREGLLKESAKGLAKGIPEDLKWFPFDQLPAVHWEENGRLVEPEIVWWWLVQGFKLKTPEPGPLLRKYCASLKNSEREALGRFVLEAWLGEDTAPITRAEAETNAHQQAQQYVQWSQTSYWPQNSPKKTLEEFYADFLPALLLQPKGSAVSSKGLLSLAGACAGAEAAPVVGRYLKQWYGMRAAQCRALLQMLAWVEHKTATQLLLAVGSRFRTRSIQEEANKQAHALAERKGWTVAELADRTIPSAGLDEAGVLSLDFGSRQFTAKLNEDLDFVLADAEGEPIKSLPDPKKDDDETKAVEAKKAFSAAKKELKTVVTLQRDRFYEAMCTQRTWPFEDWNTYLNRHPIARHHCQRLVWGVISTPMAVDVSEVTSPAEQKSEPPHVGGYSKLFRPLPDGSLTDAADDPVVLQPEDLVRIAHQCQITPEQSQAWRQHLKDYDVEPLFEQFGRLNFHLAEERKQEDELTDFRGHVVEAFKLRGRANKLGYTRGQAQDGGWFYDYHKRFPTLGMEAVIEFTGNGLPEENRTVALTMLRFERVVPENEPATGGAKISLGEVPPVLLSECWNDIRQLAAEGPGFDSEWEKKTQM